MILGLTDSLDAILRLQQALDQRLDSGWLEDMTSGSGAFPPMNVFQQGGDFVAIVELAGVRKEDLRVEVTGDALRITGKKIVDYGGGASLHRRERIAGSFDRTFTLPVELDPNRISAEYRNGLLVLALPRAESDKPRAIKVN